MSEKLLVQPPKRIPVWIRLGGWIAKRKTGKQMQAPQIFSWYKRAALSSGILEALVSHGEGKANGRLLQLVRIQISVQISCPFCTDMNTSDTGLHEVTEREIAALRSGDPFLVETFSPAR